MVWLWLVLAWLLIAALLAWLWARTIGRLNR